MPTDDPSTALRRIPPVNQLVDAVLAQADGDIARSLVVHVARTAIDVYRARLDGTGPAPNPLATLTEEATRLLNARLLPALESVINATGIIVHTGLGRAPLADVAARAAADVAGHYAPVELDVPSGKRGKRADVVAGLLTELTGAEAATVVNNTAAAIVLVLAAVATGRKVIVSRGELIEIGGSFRLPDIMQTGGADLDEVGTTNRTRLGDYEREIDEGTAAIMKVHTSNFRIQGFTEAATTQELAQLAHDHDLALIDDIGSGALRPTAEYGWPSDEPNARASVAAGADLVIFSGDKLLGGPQAGIIVGTERWVGAVERHPLMRALRVDKITLAALGATLQLHRDPREATQRIPVWRMLTTPCETLETRAGHMADRLGSIAGVTAHVIPTEAYLGGGSVPAESIESRAVAVTADAIGEEELGARLRLGRPAVFGRLSDGAVHLDVRTIFPEQDALVVDAVNRAVNDSS